MQIEKQASDAARNRADCRTKQKPSGSEEPETGRP